MINLVNFPTQLENIRVVDSGETKVFLVVKSPQNSLGGNCLLKLEGIFCGDNDSSHKPTPSDLTIEEMVEMVKYQDNQDSIYFPYFGTKRHNDSISLVAVSYLGSYPYTLEYLNDIYPWTCGYHDLNSKGQDLYQLYQNIYSDCEVKILTMSNI